MFQRETKLLEFTRQILVIVIFTNRIKYVTLNHLYSQVNLALRTSLNRQEKLLLLEKLNLSYERPRYHHL